ncbi:MAG: ABC transporter permease [Bacteroidota bacterium]
MNKFEDPPRYLLRLLKLFCKSSYFPDIEGDLIETYNMRLVDQTKRKANWLLFRDVVRLFRPGLIKSLHFTTNDNPFMIQHLLTTALRQLRKNPMLTAINGLGLTLAITCTFFIYLWVKSEISMDSFHEKDERIVQIMLNENSPNGIITEAYTPSPLAPALSNEFTEVERAVSVVPYEWFEGERFLMSNTEGKVLPTRNQFASADYFQIFSFDFKSGNPDKALSTLDAVVVSEKLAKRMFGSTEVLGRSIEWLHDDFGGVYKITGVYEDIKPNSTLQFDAVFNFEVFRESEEDSPKWTDSDPSTYALLSPHANVDQLNAKLKGYLEGKTQDTNQSLYAQLFSDRYLYNRYENGLPVGGRITYVRLFIAVAVLVLIIAYINFINLTIAQTITRSKAAGIKKVLGVKRWNLGFGLFVESGLISTLAVVLSVVLVSLLQPYFNAIIGKPISLEWNTEMVILPMLLIVITTLIVGGYPAIHMSGVKITSALKGKAYSNTSNQFQRKSLMLAQLCISAFLITGMLGVYKQMQFIQSRDLGFTKDDVIWFTMDNVSAQDGAGELNEARIEGFLQQLKTIPGVIESSNFAHNLFGEYGTTTGVNWEGKGDERALFAGISGGYDFLSTMDVQLKEGRYFSRSFQSDKEAIIFNQQAVDRMGLENPIGQTIELWGQKRTIVGIAEDFHFASLHEKIQPLFIKLDLDDFAPHIAVRLSKSDQKRTIRQIEALHQSLFQGLPFEFNHMDDNYTNMYASEIKMSRLSTIAAILAILISSLGLYGLTTFILKTRTKELAVRKVLGAHLLSLMSLLTRPFVLLGILALGITLPIGHMVIRNWLNGFAYSVTLHWSYFLVVIGAIIAAIVITISLQVLRTTRINPVENLRND